MQAAATKFAPILHPTISSFRALRRSVKPSTQIGFVPTMGALHDGHLSLVKEARAKNDLVVVSIFVNPTQFGEGEDFDKYPRQLEKDSELLSDFGVDHVFAPRSDEIYGRNHVTYVDPMGFDSIPEGNARPGHFRGVATIVTKLFNIVQPTNAYFGQKDAAQCVLIRRMVEDLNMDVNVVTRDTIREHDGLAMSSRNAYLTDEERLASPIVFQSLCAAKEMYTMKSAEVSSADLINVVEGVLRSEQLITGIDYVTVDDKSTMQPIDYVGEDGAVISLACRLGSVRLIDNIIL